MIPPTGLPTGARGKVLALGIAFMAAAIVWLGAIAPLQRWYDDRADQLQRQEAVAQRMEALVATLPALRRAAGLVRSGGSDDDVTAILVTGSSDAVAAATLQERIDALAVAAGVQIGSHEILQGQPEDDLRRIAVRLSFRAPFRSVVGLLVAFGRSPTAMTASEITLRGPGETGHDPELPTDATLTVASYRSARLAAP
jgi:hypothetical protein